MANLCVTYLTFKCFNPGLKKSEVHDHVTAGDYSFQEYATCNWLYHVESLRAYQRRVSDKEVTSFNSSCTLLRLRHYKNFMNEVLSLNFEETQQNSQNTSKWVEHLQSAYDLVDTICGDEVYQGKSAWNL